MSDTLVDTNILIDIVGRDTQWKAWARRRLRAARQAGELVINPIIYAEFSAGLPTQSMADGALRPTVYRRENLPWEAAFGAGRAFFSYRRSGGDRRSPMPDFYIGAHAEFMGYTLLTRDPGRYRQYFPTLKIISPDAAP